MPAVRRAEQSLVPCGIPYVFGSLGSTDKNLMPNQALCSAGVELEVVGEAVGLEPEGEVV